MQVFICTLEYLTDLLLVVDKVWNALKNAIGQTTSVISRTKYFLVVLIVGTRLKTEIDQAVKTF